MQKPNGFDDVTTVGSFTPISLGGHHMVIMDVQEMKSKKDQDMLVVYLDTAKNDKQPEYFKALYKSDNRPEKKWPNNGTKYIMVYDYNGDRDSNGNLLCNKDFKGFITSVEDSNPGLVIKWTDNFGAQFKGKRIGAVYGEVDSFYNGKMRTRREVRWFCGDKSVDTQQIPAKKEAKKSFYASVQTEVPTDANGFMSIPEDADDDSLPF